MRKSARKILPTHVLQDIDSNVENSENSKIKTLQASYAGNKIQTTKYTALSFLPKNLFEQFHRFANVYFVFIVLLNFVPQISAIQPELSLVPVIAILTIQAIKDLIEDHGRRKSDLEVNSSYCEIFSK